MSATILSHGPQRFLADAAAGLSLKFGLPVAPAVAQNPDVQLIAGASMMQIAHRFLELNGKPAQFGVAREQVITSAMQVAPDFGRLTVKDFGASVNTPGSFPQLLSGLVRKIVVEAAQASKVRYESWVGRYPGFIPDFKPAPVVSLSSVHGLDEVTDAEPFREVRLAEESLDYVQCGRYANTIRITPVMLANDDTGAILSRAKSLAAAGARRLNKLCLGLLSKTLNDGKTVYHADRGNLVVSGAVPSGDSWQAMLNLCYGQRVLGDDGEPKPYADIPLSVALVPPQLERAALQTFYNQLVDFPTTSANVNVYRGRVVTVVEADLQATSSAEWFGLCDPRLQPAFVYGFCDGYDEKGRSESWYDPNTACWNYSFETRFGAAVADPRLTVKNPGA